MTHESRHKEGRSLIILGVFVLVLMFLTSWSFRAGSVIAGSFQVDDILICEELSGDMRPLPTSGDLAEGLKQICLWFSYSRAREGDVLELSWRYGDETIQRDSFRLAERNGMRAFYLLREDGSSLPSGDYAVTLFCNGREKIAEAFHIRSDGLEDDDADATDEDIATVDGVSAP